MIFVVNLEPTVPSLLGDETESLNNMAFMIRFEASYKIHKKKKEKKKKDRERESYTL